MATNALLTPSLITKETLALLANNLVAANKVNRQFENQFIKIGTTLTVRKTNRFKVTLGPALQIQDITEPSTSITISQQAHVTTAVVGPTLLLTGPARLLSVSLEAGTAATGGDMDSEGGTNGMEKSYSKIAAEARAEGKTPALAMSFLTEGGDPRTDGDWVAIPAYKFKEWFS